MPASISRLSERHAVGPPFVHGLLDELALGEAKLDDHVADAALGARPLAWRPESRHGKRARRGGRLSLMVHVSAAGRRKSSGHSRSRSALLIRTYVKGVEHVGDLEDPAQRTRRTNDRKALLRSDSRRLALISRAKPVESMNPTRVRSTTTDLIASATDELSTLISLEAVAMSSSPSTRTNSTPSRDVRSTASGCTTGRDQPKSDQCVHCPTCPAASGRSSRTRRRRGGLVEVGDLLEVAGLDGHQYELRYAVARLDLERVHAVGVEQQHPHLAAVPGVDQSGCVDDRDAVARRQARAWHHQPGLALRDRHGDARPDAGPLTGRDRDRLGGVQVVSGVALVGLGGGRAATSGGGSAASLGRAAVGLEALEARGDRGGDARAHAHAFGGVGALQLARKIVQL